jgi:hypothetical protein
VKVAWGKSMLEAQATNEGSGQILKVTWRYRVDELQQVFRNSFLEPEQIGEISPAELSKVESQMIRTVRHVTDLHR